MRVMPRASATRQACWPAAPPKQHSVYPATSCPRCTEIFLIASAMLPTAISTNPSATCSAVRVSPVALRMIGCGGYRIDLGVVHPDAPGTYLAGVECDGASYHSGATARDRDRLRQHKLEELGWKLQRIWSLPTGGAGLLSRWISYTTTSWAWRR